MAYRNLKRPTQKQQAGQLSKVLTLQGVTLKNKTMDYKKGVAEGLKFYSVKPRRSCMPCGGRTTLLKRPMLPLRIVNKNIAINAGDEIFAAIVADTDWGNGEGLSRDKNRIIISRLEDPNQNYSLIQDHYLRWVRPNLQLFVTVPGSPLSKDLSEQVYSLALSNLALIIDEDGKGKQLALAPSMFEHGVKRGISLDEDQIFKFSDNSTIAFDFNGEGDLSDYVATDIKSGSGMNVSVSIGCDVIITDTPDEDIEDLIELAMAA